MLRIKKKRFSGCNMGSKKGSSSMSEKQKRLMIEFLSVHPSMVRDRSVGGISNRDDRDELWEDLASALNSCEPGAQKDGAGWRRSWQDLKRYESLKAKESMARLDKLSEHMREPPKLLLSPLQERIAHVLNESICVAADSIETCTHDNQGKTNQPTEPSCKSKKTEFQSEKAHMDKSGDIAENSFHGSTNTATELSTAHALQSIAHALTERNMIEERKLKVFENLLTVCAVKKGLDVNDLVNLDFLS